jgi:hypothetical protein
MPGVASTTNWRPLRLDWIDPDPKLVKSDPEFAKQHGPQLAVVAHQTDAPYTVTVELRFDRDGAPFVIGVAVRRQTPWWEEDGWEAGEERPHVSPRDVQRLPLAGIVRAALAAASAAERRTLETGEPVTSETARVLTDQGEDWDWAEDARKVLTPHGRPQHGKSAKWYSELADSYRGFARAGKSPVKEIATRKRVSENTVHQWVHRAREIGVLEPSPRSKRPGQDARD